MRHSPDGTTNDQQATVAQGAVFGAIVGGLLGAAVSDNRGRGALIGAAAGGLIGAGIGSSIAERKAQYANGEDFLVAEIRRNQGVHSGADAQNRQLYRKSPNWTANRSGWRGNIGRARASRDALVRQKATVENNWPRPNRSTRWPKNNWPTPSRSTRNPSGSEDRRINIPGGWSPIWWN